MSIAERTSILKAGAVAAAAATALCGAATASAETPTDRQTGTRLSLGPVEPLTAADARALYGANDVAAAGVAPARPRAYGARGCRTVRTISTFNRKLAGFGPQYRVFSLHWATRFCWDKGRKRAAQRGVQQAFVDVAKKGTGLGISFGDTSPEPSYTARWHGAGRGMTVMRARFEEKNAGVPAGPVAFTKYRFVSIHGHYDGSAHKVVYSKDG